MATSHFVPLGRYPALSRPRVVERAVESAPALVVMHGGPGTGKSVAAVEVAEALAPDNADIVWLRVTTAERNSGALWARLFKVLVDAGVAHDGSLSEQLHAGGVASADNELLAEALWELQSPLVLVFDDLHHVEDAISEPLLVALERSSRLRIVATSRTPLEQFTSKEARLRTRLCSVDESTLAFTTSEIQKLVALRSPKATADEITATTMALQRESTGWPIAVHAGIVEREYDPHGRVRTQRGHFARRYVDRMLDACDTEQRRLLCSAALLEEVSVQVLSRMTQVEPGTVATVLAGTKDASLRHWEDDRGVRWYRHHDLIRDELRKRINRELDQDDLHGAYHRAALALADDRPREAVRAALLGQSWALLSELIATNLTRTATMARVERRGPWLKDIPQRVRDQYPILAAFALIDEFAYPSGRFGRVITGFKAFAGRALTDESARPGLQGMVASSLRMVAARLGGNERMSLEMADRSIETYQELGEEDVDRFRASLPVATTQTAITFLYAERFDDAEEVLERNLGKGGEAQAHGFAHALALSALSAAWRGDIRRARSLIEQCRQFELPLGWRNAYIGVGYRLASALIMLEDGDADAAAEHLDALAEHEPTTEHWPYLVHVDAMIVENRAGQSEALARLDWQLARKRGRFSTLTTTDRSLHELRSRIAWQAGRLAQRDARDDTGISPVFTAFSTNRNEEARTLVARLLKDREIVGYPRRHATLLLLHAEAHRREGDLQSAKASARAATELLEKFDMTLPLRVIPRGDLKKLSELAPGLRPELGGSGTGARITPLTTSERRALTAVSAHGTVPGAAQALFLSENTVKSQVRTAYRKLGVNDRDHAIRIATAAGLLDPGLINMDNKK